MSLTTWICDECYNVMEVTRIKRGVYLVYCPHCGNEYYVDSDDQLIDY